MSITIHLPLEIEKQFLAETQNEEQDVITKLILDYLDKKERQKRREALLKNPSPIVAKWAEAFAKTNGSQWTDADIAKAKDDYLTEKYGM